MFGDLLICIVDAIVLEHVQTLNRRALPTTKLGATGPARLSSIHQSHHDSGLAAAVRLGIRNDTCDWSRDHFHVLFARNAHALKATAPR